MELSTLIQGALAVKDGYPARLTKNQRNWYHAISKEFADRADCTAGASLAFMTDVQRFSLSYEVISYCRSTNVIDVLEKKNSLGALMVALAIDAEKCSRD